MLLDLAETIRDERKALFAEIEGICDFFSNLKDVQTLSRADIEDLSPDAVKRSVDGEIDCPGGVCRMNPVPRSGAVSVDGDRLF